MWFNQLIYTFFNAILTLFMCAVVLEKVPLLHIGRCTPITVALEGFRGPLHLVVCVLRRSDDWDGSFLHSAAVGSFPLRIRYRLHIPSSRSDSNQQRNPRSGANANELLLLLANNNNLENHQNNILSRLTTFSSDTAIFFHFFATAFDLPSRVAAGSFASSSSSPSASNFQPRRSLRIGTRKRSPPPWIDDWGGG